MGGQADLSYLPIRYAHSVSIMLKPVASYALLHIRFLRLATTQYHLPSLIRPPFNGLSALRAPSSHPIHTCQFLQRKKGTGRDGKGQVELSQDELNSVINFKKFEEPMAAS